MRRARIWIVFLMLFGLEGVVAGQIILERGLNSGRAAVSTAPSRGLRKSVAGVMNSLDKTVKTGMENSGSGSPRPSRRVSVQPVEEDPPTAPIAVLLPARIYEDPREIREGMANDELVRRFGPPALEVTGGSIGKTLTYAGKNNVVQLELRDEKVMVIAAREPNQTTIILPAEQGFRQIP